MEKLLTIPDDLGHKSELNPTHHWRIKKQEVGPVLIVS
ncbi:hypothetical protein LEMLEM_LOCUS7585 [Lemmus lemmus]